MKVLGFKIEEKVNKNGVKYLALVCVTDDPNNSDKVVGFVGKTQVNCLVAKKYDK